MREIVLDTETTGLEPRKGDRVVEIGAVELLNQYPTGKTFHVYLNPERPMPAEAFRVHGLSDDFLRDKPKFAEIAADFVAFVADARLIIHNASFDVGFLDMELERVGLPPIDPTRVIDTLAMARRKHPADRNSLDALCARYGIDNSRRTKHGALLDSEILAEVYLEMIGGKQADLGLGGPSPTPANGVSTARRTAGPVRPRPVPLAPRLTDEERAAHAAFVAKLGEGALWKLYDTPGTE